MDKKSGSDTVKDTMKKIPPIRFLGKKVKFFITVRDFGKDKAFFKKYYAGSVNTKEKIEYQLMFLVHQIEKGFTASSIRPFGQEKVKKMIKLLSLYEARYDYPGYYYDLALSCLHQYQNLYKTNGWTQSPEYLVVKNFLNNRLDQYHRLQAGAIEIHRKTIDKNRSINYEGFLKSRHSIREYDNKELSPSDINEAIKMASLSPTACNRQMCKIYHIKSKEAKDAIVKYAQGLSLCDLKNANYFVVTFDTSAFVMIGERNQGWFNAGLVSMNFVNALHSLGIGSCFCQFGNSFKEETGMKKSLHIPKSERIAVIIVAGYYPEKTKVPSSTRKNVEDLYITR